MWAKVTGCAWKRELVHLLPSEVLSLFGQSGTGKIHHLWVWSLLNTLTEFAELGVFCCFLKSLLLFILFLCSSCLLPFCLFFLLSFSLGRVGAEEQEDLSNMRRKWSLQNDGKGKTKTLKQVAKSHLENLQGPPECPLKDSQGVFTPLGP